MSMSRPAWALLLGARDLEAGDMAAGRGVDYGWDLATLVLAARPYVPVGARQPSAKTAGSLAGDCRLYVRKDGRYELTQAGRQRIREGL